MKFGSPKMIKNISFTMVTFHEIWKYLVTFDDIWVFFVIQSGVLSRYVMIVSIMTYHQPPERGDFLMVTT